MLIASLLSRVQELLKKYEGTHNFHNFTSGKSVASLKNYLLCTHPHTHTHTLSLSL